MAACNRAPSPVLKRKEKERHNELVLEENKIHRIQLGSPAVCKVAHVESPNCVWFKLVNNIAEDLRVVKPAKLEPQLAKPKPKPDVNNNKEDHHDQGEQHKEHQPAQNGNGNLDGGGKQPTRQPENGVPDADGEAKMQKEVVEEVRDPLAKFNYVLAPLQENVYARARILCTKDLHQQRFVYVHFIDEGFGDWMGSKCLAKMEPHLYTHPWQAFPVALFKVRADPETSDWPPGLTEVLIELLNDFEYFKVVPIYDSRRHPNYFEYARADVFGLDSFEDEEGPSGKGESIGHRLMYEYDELLQMFWASKEPQNDDNVSDLTKAARSLVLDKCFDRTLFDAKQQPLVKAEGIPPLTSQLLAEMPRWRLKWPRRFGANPTGQPAGDEQPGDGAVQVE